ncbi:MAG: EAL domain-containing protein [Marinagarivorans sp.]|nr:EAL domain-containing protein [Marinagarivorans sp.]
MSEHTPNIPINVCVRTTLLQRTQSLIYIAIAASITVLLLPLKSHGTLSILLICASIPLLIGCLLITKRNQALGATCFIWIISLADTAILWSAAGYLGPGILGVPCILIFAAMLGVTRSFWVLILFFSLNILAMGYCYHAHFITFSNAAYDPIRPAFTVVIVLICATAIHLLIKDYSTAITNLSNENAKVRESERAIAFLANHDSLTELPNRALASDRFNQAVQRIERNLLQKKIALIFIDLDDFKNINDSLGHEIGDRYLIAIAERLRDATRASDTVCRLGGDEFLLILEDLDDERDASKVADTVQQRISRPVVTGQHKLVCSASIGLSIYPNDGECYDELVKKADIAMYRSKDLGRNTFSYFSPSMNTDALERMQLLEDLRGALQRSELYIEFQPIIFLSTGAIVGAEALVRWHHPKRGFVGPDVFIPLAEKSGLIVEIGAWVLEHACREIVALQKNYLPDFRLSVNVSSVQLKRVDFKERVRDILARVPIAPHTLELEITESELISDSPEFDDAIKQLKEMNISLAIDDFGTGYSNLGYVQKIKVAKLKIDRSFVSGIESNLDNQAIVRAVHNIADGLVMNTVAEGVESIAELAVLKALGITHGQGYLWSKSISMAALIALLQKNDLG